MREVTGQEGGLGTFVTLEASDSFGFSVASVGDLNGDGTLELAVGASDDDDGRGSSEPALDGSGSLGVCLVHQPL